VRRYIREGKLKAEKKKNEGACERFGWYLRMNSEDSRTVKEVAYNVAFPLSSLSALSGNRDTFDPGT